MKNLKFSIMKVIWDQIRDQRGTKPIIDHELSDVIFNLTWGVIEKSAMESVYQNIRL